MSSKHLNAALKRGADRSAKVAKSVLEAMKTIRREMKANGGIYPANGGAVSKNEVARRAGIHPTTLFSDKQKRLGERVSRWCELLKRKETVGRVRVRRTYAERAEDWEARYTLVVTHLDLAELKVQAAESERDDAIAKVQKLERENAALLDQMRKSAAGKVTPIPKNGKR
ncbi:MAG: hypothetical protein H6R17_3081 [Proteobacteria bacterium]|nr:hypothetical protein [Pseudomonadota bacterium]